MAADNALRVAVTGSTGLLGATLVPLLRERGHEVACLNRSGRGARGAELADFAAAASALDSIAPDVIVNLAAATSVDECERDPQLAYRGNALVVRNLASWIAMSGRPCHLVQLSTDQLYDGAGPHSEDDISPINYYAFSKLAGELLAMQVPATVLRTNLFGVSRCEGRASISDWLVKMMRQNQPIQVFEDVLFSPLTLETLSSMIELVVRRRVTGVFNLGSRLGMSKADFAFRLAQILQLPTDKVSRAACSAVPLAARRPSDMRMNCQKFESSFDVALPTLDTEIMTTRSAYASQA